VSYGFPSQLEEVDILARFLVTEEARTESGLEVVAASLVDTVSVRDYAWSVLQRLTAWQTHKRQFDLDRRPPAELKCVYPWHGVYEYGVNFLCSGDAPLLCSRRRSYVVTVHPLRDEYQTTALLGEWSDSDMKVWREWMGDNNRRSIGNGKLFNRVHQLSCGSVFWTEWMRSEFVSKVTRGLKFAYGVVVPIYSGGRCIGILTRDEPQAPTEERCGQLFQLAQNGLLPLLLPAAETMDNPRRVEMTVAVYRRLLEPPLRHVAQVANAEIRALKEADSALATRMAGQFRVIRDRAMMVERTINLLVPKKAVAGTVSPDEAVRLCREVLDLYIRVDPAAGGAKFEREWLTTNFEADVLIPPDVFRFIMIELLMNAVKAVLDRKHGWATGEEEQDPSGDDQDSNDNLPSDEKYLPCVVVTVRSGADGLTLDVANNGTPMPDFVRIRASDFGFTTRLDGTGIGLSIVQMQAERYGGWIAYIGTRGEWTHTTIRFPTGPLTTESI
jgi:hypothetical protein